MVAAQNAPKLWKNVEDLSAHLEMNRQVELTNQLNGYLITYLHPPTDFISQVGLDP
jgi:hypothetical protein